MENEETLKTRVGAEDARIYFGCQHQRPMLGVGLRVNRHAAEAVADASPMEGLAPSLRLLKAPCHSMRIRWSLWDALGSLRLQASLAKRPWASCSRRALTFEAQRDSETAPQPQRAWSHS